MKFLNTLIDEFEAAVRADEFSGGGAPEDVPLIEEDLKQARKALWNGIGEVLNYSIKGEKICLGTSKKK